MPMGARLGTWLACLMVATMAGSLELRKAEMTGSRTVDGKVGRRDVSLVDGKVVRTVLMSVVEWVDWKDD